MAEPVDDELFADIAPHYAERARFDLIERAEESGGAVVALEAIDELLSQLPTMDGKRDPRKHGDECWKRHTDCLATKIVALMSNGY